MARHNSWMFDVRCSMFDVRCSMLDVRCWMFDVGCWMFDVRCSMFDVGCWMLDCWIVPLGDMKASLLFLCLPICALLSACATVRTPPVKATTGPLVGDEQRLQGSWKVIHNELMRTRTPQMLGRVHIYFGRCFRLDTDNGSEEFRIDEQS